MSPSDHPAVIDIARRYSRGIILRRWTHDVHPPFGVALSRPPLPVRRNNCIGPFVYHPLRHSRQRLSRPPGHQRNDRPPVAPVQRPGTKASRICCPKRAVPLQRRVQFPVNFARHSVPRRFSTIPSGSNRSTCASIASITPCTAAAFVAWKKSDCAASSRSGVARFIRADALLAIPSRPFRQPGCLGTGSFGGDRRGPVRQFNVYRPRERSKRLRIKLRHGSRQFRLVLRTLREKQRIQAI